MLQRDDPDDPDDLDEPPAHAASEPEPPATGRTLPPVVSRRALDLVAAFGLAQRNVTLTISDPALAGQLERAKAEQVRAYHALLAYVAELEGRPRR